MGNPESYFFQLPSSGRPAPFKIPEVVYSDAQWYNDHRSTSRVFHPINGIEGVAIHATAGGSTQGALNWWKDPAGKASAHWIVPDEDEAGHGNTVLAVVSESLAAWHVQNSKTHPKLGNKKKINHWTVGIEIVNQQISSDDFSDWQLEVTALIVRYCWAKYPNLKYIFSHALVDPTRRSDPGSQFDWDAFCTLIVSSANDPAADALNVALSSAVSLPAGANARPPEECYCSM